MVKLNQVRIVVRSHEHVIDQFPKSCAPNRFLEGRDDQAASGPFEAVGLVTWQVLHNVVNRRTQCVLGPLSKNIWINGRQRSIQIDKKVERTRVKLRKRHSRTT